MNNLKQPKFKFGDKVIRGFTVFIVRNINYNSQNGNYFYSSDITEAQYIEYDLELYEGPPRTKKVYQFIFKLEGGMPTVGYDLWDSEEQFREHLFGYNRKQSVEYIKLANTFEVPE